MSEQNRPQVGSYDTELNQFVEASQEPNPNQLAFLRWLAEQGRLEHETFGRPEGEFALEPLSVPETGLQRQGVLFVPGMEGQAQTANAAEGPQQA